MPVNAFRSWNEHPVFKARQTDSDVTWFKINYLQLVANFRGDSLSKQLLAELFHDDEHQRNLRTLSRLEFIYWCDRVRAVIDDQLRIFIEDEPLRIIPIYNKFTAEALRLMNQKELEIQVTKAGNRLTNGSVEDVAARMLEKFDIEIFRGREVSILRYVFEVRNLLVHRGENVDIKFIYKTGSKKVLGELITIPRIKTLSTRPMSLVQSFPDRITSI
jgi:hypothetical protein